KEFFPAGQPVRRRIGLGGSEKAADIEIIGVAKTTLYRSIKETETPSVAYVPYTQVLPGLSRVHFELRTAGDSLALVNAVRQTVHKPAPVCRFPRSARRPRGSIRPSARSARSPGSARVLQRSPWRSLAWGYTAR